MSKSLVRILSSLLLVGFLGFLVPINNWHALAHTHTAKHANDPSDGLTFKQGFEKCALCDLQVPLLFNHTPNAVTSWKASFDFLFTNYICSELPVKDTPLSLRGPPLNDWI